MKERFAFHSFGHHEGRYQTIDALGISPTEAKPLEQFFFGQTNNDAYLAGLHEAPGIIWRTVGDRGALTRVRQGESDAHGRDTLRFETLLIEKPKFKMVIEHFAQVVIAQWDTNSDGVHISVDATQDSAAIHAEKVSEVVMAVRSGKRVVHRADEFSFRDVAKIIGACGADPAFSLCFKSLNKAAPVTVNLLSLESVEKSMSSPQIRTPKEAAPRPQAAAAKRAPAQSSPWMLGVVCVVLIIQSVMFFRMSQARSTRGTDENKQNTELGYFDRLEDNLRGTNKDLTLAKLNEDQKAGVAKLEDSLAKLASDLEKIKSENELLRQTIESRLNLIETEQKKAQEQISEMEKRIAKDVENKLQVSFLNMTKVIRSSIIEELKRLMESKPQATDPTPGHEATGKKESDPNP